MYRKIGKKLYGKIGKDLMINLGKKYAKTSKIFVY